MARELLHTCLSLLSLMTSNQTVISFMGSISQLGMSSVVPARFSWLLVHNSPVSFFQVRLTLCCLICYCSFHKLTSIDGQRNVNVVFRLYSNNCRSWQQHICTVIAWDWTVYPYKTRRESVDTSFPLMPKTHFKGRIKH